MAAGAVAALCGTLIYRSDRILPAVRVADVPVGGQRMVDAGASVQRWWSSGPVAVNAGDTRREVSAADLGLRLDASATVWAAYQAGRSVPGWWAALRSGHLPVTTPIWSLDARTASTTLAALAAAVDRPAVPASLRLVDGRAQLAEAVAGVAVDQAATLIVLQREGAAVIARRELRLITRSVPAPGRDVAAALVAANHRLARPLAVTAFDPVRGQTVEWSVPGASWARWSGLGIASTDGRHVQWSAEVAFGEALAASGADHLGEERYVQPAAAATAVVRALDEDTAVRVRAYHQARHHVVVPGDTVATIALRYGVPYPWILAANPEADQGLWPGQELAIPSPDEFLPLPVVEGKRIVVSLSDQRLRAFEGEELRWEWSVSTGIADSPTSPGVYQVQSHEPEAYASSWELWMPKFVGIYRPAPDSPILNGFHGFPRRGEHQILWAGSLGHPVTYGCILLGTKEIDLLYDWAEDGVVVEITP